MRNTIITFFNRPLLVTIVSLAIAGVIAAFALSQSPGFVQNALLVSEQSATTEATSSAHLTLAFLGSGRIESVSVKVGDSVRKDQLLASLDPQNTAGALTQAKAAYASAQAAYEKTVNGATGPAVAVAKAAVTTAKTNLDTATKQQDALVVNARRKLHSDGLVAISTDVNRRDVVPTITGTFEGTAAGSYHLYFASSNDVSNRFLISFGGLESGTAGKSDVPQPLGTLGLRIAFPTGVEYFATDDWTIDIPNKNSANYVTNLNAYQAAVQTHDETIAAAQAALDQAQASLALTAAAARPEDVAAAQAAVEQARGTLQIAESAYGERVIRAPQSGSITAVHISEGEIAAQNAPAIEMTASQP